MQEEIKLQTIKDIRLIDVCYTQSSWPSDTSSGRLCIAVCTRVRPRGNAVSRSSRRMSTTSNLSTVWVDTSTRLASMPLRI
ncbi:hypothetical protein Taro_010840 [Colocasia esculenta]|uniref:Uncharacterized protein n=1 Tax=Colocasia esculenta TaxID=4460 RepID=A0A843U8L2_COLES|nr:hypothetical protein [Colocasia esculenta]